MVSFMLWLNNVVIDKHDNLYFNCYIYEYVHPNTVNIFGSMQQMKPLWDVMRHKPWPPKITWIVLVEGFTHIWWRFWVLDSQSAVLQVTKVFRVARTKYDTNSNKLWCHWLDKSWMGRISHYQDTNLIDCVIRDEMLNNRLCYCDNLITKVAISALLARVSRDSPYWNITQTNHF